MLGDDYRKLIFSIAHQTAQVCKEDMADQLHRLTGGTVQSGPFAGMRVPTENSWVAEDRSSKLLGCYEQELHLAIEKAIKRQPGLVVNVGCAGAHRIVTPRRFSSGRSQKLLSRGVGAVHHVSVFDV
jgi:hypothetical protein